MKDATYVGAITCNAPRVSEGGANGGIPSEDEKRTDAKWRRRRRRRRAHQSAHPQREKKIWRPVALRASRIVAYLAKE